MRGRDIKKRGFAPLRHPYNEAEDWGQSPRGWEERQLKTGKGVRGIGY